ncbi:MAG: hypothetical protein Fur0021_34390 [Candidatus Promineifilaceae bacterium]
MVNKVKQGYMQYTPTGAARRLRLRSGVEFRHWIPVTKYSRLPDICHYSCQTFSYMLDHKERRHAQRVRTGAPLS